MLRLLTHSYMGVAMTLNPSIHVLNPSNEDSIDKNLYTMLNIVKITFIKSNAHVYRCASIADEKTARSASSFRTSLQDDPFW